MAQLLVRATATAEGFCYGWTGYVNSANPTVQDLLAAGYLTTDAAIPPVTAEPCCLPAGGSPGQVLRKTATFDLDAGWSTVAGHVSGQVQSTSWITARWGTR